MIALINRLPSVAQRFLRFVVVGLVNTGVGYLLYALLYLLTPLGPQWSLLVAFWLGVLWNYVTTSRFVFGAQGFGRLPAYVLCYLAIYLLNAQALHLMVTAGLAPLVAQALLTPVAAVLTFALMSVVLTWRRSEQPE